MSSGQISVCTLQIIYSSDKSKQTETEEIWETNEDSPACVSAIMGDDICRQSACLLSISTSAAETLCLLPGNQQQESVVKWSEAPYHHHYYCCCCTHLLCKYIFQVHSMCRFYIWCFFVSFFLFASAVYFTLFRIPFLKIFLFQSSRSVNGTLTKKHQTCERVFAGDDCLQDNQTVGAVGRQVDFLQVERLFWGRKIKFKKNTLTDLLLGYGRINSLKDSSPMTIVLFSNVTLYIRLEHSSLLQEQHHEAVSWLEATTPTTYSWELRRWEQSRL